MEKYFVIYQESVTLRELGFNEPCLAGHSTSTEKLEFYSRPLITKDSFTVDAPTYSQAFGFFREKYKLQPSVNSFCFEEYSFNIMGNRNEILYPIQHKLLNDGKKNPWEFDTYEEAELACLRKLIEIVKQKQP
jgi:hypothetical protein